ncbi:metallophosphoesterase family protein [Patescibacteria group bacterium]
MKKFKTSYFFKLFISSIILVSVFTGVAFYWFQGKEKPIIPQEQVKKNNEKTQINDFNKNPYKHVKTRFAVIGDYGVDNLTEKVVSDLINAWQPDFIATVGDNRQTDNSYKSLDDLIGKYYHQYIYPYKGEYGRGADSNMFFPSLGNHDWDLALTCKKDKCNGEWVEFFTLPGNERYYDIVWPQNTRIPLLHLMFLDSDYREPDGNSATSKQAIWLQDKLINSKALWKLVFMHHSPFSSYNSGKKAKSYVNQWPFEKWGVTAVISGHNHVYERSEKNGVLYLVTGMAGGPLYEFGETIPESKMQYNERHGALFITATDKEIEFSFVNIDNETIDTFKISAN